jgi:hypothetical protein
MKSLQLLRHALRLFRSTRLLWLLGFLATLGHISQFRDSLAGVEPALAFLFVLASLVASFYSLIASGAMVRLVYLIEHGESASFEAAWGYSGARIFRIVGGGLLLSPAIFIILAIYLIFVRNVPASPFLWLFAWLMQTAFGSLSAFLLCAILIDDLKATSAAWTSLLITRKNFFVVLPVFGGILLLRGLLTGLVALLTSFSPLRITLPAPVAYDYLTYLLLGSAPLIIVAGWLFDLLLVPLTSVIVTLCYLKFTREQAYPALLKPELLQQ